jgi:ribosomal protein S18 acetylase RimI-like enzyme
MPALPVNRSLFRNLSSAMSAYAGATPSGRLLDLGGLSVADSGLDYAAFNSAIVPEGLAPPALLESIAEAIRYFGSAKRSWSCWMCDDLLPDEARLAVSSLLWKHGMRLQAEHQGMAADAIRPPRRAPPELDMRPLDRAEARADFAYVCAQVFAVPGWVARTTYGGERFWSGALRGWVGYSRGRAVTISASAVVDSCVGVYSVGTLPEQRNRGFGEAAMRHAIAEARRSAPAASGQVVLQSTPAGISLYRGMGFANATRVSVFMGA